MCHHAEGAEFICRSRESYSRACLRPLPKLQRSFYPANANTTRPLPFGQIDFSEDAKSVVVNVGSRRSPAIAWE